MRGVARLHRAFPTTPLVQHPFPRCPPPRQEEGPGVMASGSVGRAVALGWHGSTGALRAPEVPSRQAQAGERC